MNQSFALMLAMPVLAVMLAIALNWFAIAFVNMLDAVR